MPVNRKRIKLVSAITVLLVAGFLVTSFASYYVSRASLRSEISSGELPITSDNIYFEIRNDLRKPILISEFMASDTFVLDWVTNGEADVKKISRYLEKTAVEFKAFTCFFVSEKTRHYYYPGGILKKVLPAEDRDSWYFRVKEMEENYEINVEPDFANSDEMTIFINYRVCDADGAFIGATGVGLNVSSVNRLIDDYQKKYNRIIYLIDKDGHIKLSGKDYDKGITNIYRQPYNSIFREKLTHPAESAFTLQKEGQVFHVNISYINEFDWFLVVEQPEAAAIKNISGILKINIFICIAVSLLILFLVNLLIEYYQEKIETLRGIVPICSYCHQIRDDNGYWNRVDAYVEQHTKAQFSHSICPSCLKDHFPTETK